jgi:predicted RNase H-like HicB family nuclease
MSAQRVIYSNGTFGEVWPPRKHFNARLPHTGYHIDYNNRMITLSVELEQEDDGRWIAEVAELPGVLAYGENPEDARAKAQAIALRVFADRLEHGEAGPDLLSISFKAA